jgi:hypothetical protein
VRERFLLAQTTAVAGVLLGLSTYAAAECVMVTPKQYRADAIFAGRFVKKEVISRFSPQVTGLAPVTGDGEEALRDRTAFGMRLTFEVHMVWKGPLSRTAIVYQVLNPDSTDHWKPGTDYLILANRLSDEERSYVFLGPGDEGFLVQNCSGASSWTPEVESNVRRALGVGRTPNEP